MSNALVTVFIKLC